MIMGTPLESVSRRPLTVDGEPLKRVLQRISTLLAMSACGFAFGAESSNTAAPLHGKQALWSFVAPRQTAAPAIPGDHWGRNPIDAFVLSKLNQNGLRPAPAEEPEILLRRV